ncbi:MAG: GDP-mannose 4,6-dehydratase [Lachnospiraceae bacterium]|nr:GDP-mannose 4,6-dehydratase [Lachnospiraceae bacterium]
MDSVLVFGAAGFVGPYLIKEFLNHDYEVFGCDMRHNSISQICSDYYVCDMMDLDLVKSMINKVQPSCIVNLAAISSVGMSWKIPQKTMEVNVCGALNILEAVRICELDTKILFIGSSEEYEPSKEAISEKNRLSANNPYGISKMTLEKFTDVYKQRYGMKIYHVRAFNHTGVGQSDNFVIPSWCKQVAKIHMSGQAGIMRVGNLDIYRDFSNVRDVVRAYRMILESDDFDTIYNVGNGEKVALRDILSYIISLTDQSVKVETDPKLFRPVENDVIYCDNSLIKEKLGWEPEFNIFDTVKDIFDYYTRR